MTRRAQLCLALDVDTLDATRKWVRRTRDRVDVCKVGLELFCAEGWAAVDAARAEGARSIFLDLELHDIPNTVAGATRAAARRDVDYLTLHTAGGPDMLAAAREACGDTTLLGVTVFTSLDNSALTATGVEVATDVLVRKRIALGLSAGLHGFVLSPVEVANAREAHGAAPLLLTPGIRLDASAVDDQARVTSPEHALEAGADILVVGRAATAHANPDAVLGRLAEMVRR